MQNTNNASQNFNALQGEIDAPNVPSRAATDHLVAAINPVHQGQERQSFFQRIGQVFQSLRACSGRQVLDQVNLDQVNLDQVNLDQVNLDQVNLAAALPPPAETLGFNVAPVPTPAILALSAIDRLSPSFTQENDLNARMGQLLSSQSFQACIDHILWRRAQGSNPVQSAQYLTHLNLLSLNLSSSRAPNGNSGPTSVEVIFQARFSARSSHSFQITHIQGLAEGSVFTVDFNSHRPTGNLTVSLRRALIPSAGSGAFVVARGQEFGTLSRILRNRPEQQIDQVQYQSNGRNEVAVDMGGPLRECFTQAHEQALNALMKDTQLQGARKDIDNHTNAVTVEAHTVQLSDFGRLLAHVADQPKVNLPPHLFEQSFEAILTVAKHSHALGIEGQNSSSDLLQSARQALSHNKAILPDVVTSLFPEIKTFLETHFDDPLAKYADSSQPTPEDAKALLSEYLSDHLEQALGLCYSADTDTVTIPDGNSRFLQLAFIANGFNAVREARTNILSAVYPADIKALAICIKGTGDIRRALSDPTYGKVFTLTDESQTIDQTGLNTFKSLIHQWAGKAHDQQLSAVCRAMTSSDVLPDLISNGTNRLAIQIRNIPVIQSSSGEVLGYAEFSPHTCFGTLEIAPHVVQEILAEHQQNPRQMPARLERLLGEELPSESQRFNAP